MLSTLAFETPKAQVTKARELGPKRVAVAGAESEVALMSARVASEEGLIDPVLVGDEAAIRAKAKTIAWDLSGIEIIACASEVESSAKAVELARAGEVHMVMKGSVHTDALMRAAVDREKGLRTDRRMSHVFQMTFPGSEKALYITDAALNVAPDVSLRLDITRNAVDLLHRTGLQTPKVAILSAVEVQNPSVPSSMEAAEIAELAAGPSGIEDAVVEGPLSFDLAVSPNAAQIKGLNSPVAGQADLIVVPTIETGNALFKSLVCFRSATAAGFVLGAKVPIILTSRADPPEARLAATALAMMV